MNDARKKILEYAELLVGTPYKYAVKPEEIPQFLDCSSFTQEIYKKIGIEIPRSTILQAAQSGKEISLSTNESGAANLHIGDLLFFRGSKGHYNDELFPNRSMYIGHVALYIGGDNAIHASSPEGVIKENINSIIKSRGPIVIIKRIL